jgi:hypothetical protein
MLCARVARKYDRQLQAMDSGRTCSAASASGKRSTSENTALFALYRMEYHPRMTGHGFRGLEATVLNEHGFNRDAGHQRLRGGINAIREAHLHLQNFT